MAIKSNIDGVDVVLEGEELEAFLAQREKDAKEAEAFWAELEAREQTRKDILAKLGLTEEEAKIFLS
jgi:predicted CoA-binding protein